MYNFCWKSLYLAGTNRHDTYFHVVSQMVRVLSGKTHGAGRKHTPWLETVSEGRASLRPRSQHVLVSEATMTR